eukprot:gnl/TRDRNA2_/TRDRNA2_177149_c8_seq5.p2 gnl/TRDRNA2_/TRDRNA2_177149_c8~~gnl/TRDRNA2_/TRDRNA2_177149_c8_seq5.p2  ORF type:complete len:104 (-),score=5.62 gnl/TRDRNA2_/TRDRNA2_177149_c8_seq5:13-324(-)
MCFRVASGLWTNNCRSLSMFLDGQLHVLLVRPFVQKMCFSFAAGLTTANCTSSLPPASCIVGSGRKLPNCPDADFLGGEVASCIVGFGDKLPIALMQSIRIGL